MPENIPLINAVREASPDFEQLSDENLQLVIANTASESKCLVLGAVEEQGVADSTSLRQGFEELYQKSEIANVPSFTGSYYAEICKQQAKHGIILMQQGVRGQSVNKYSLSTLSEVLVLPWAGQLLNWAIEHNVNLREFWNEPRVLKPEETSGTLTLFAVLARLSKNEATQPEVESILNDCFGDTTRRDLIGRELKRLNAHPYIEKRDGKFKIVDSRLETVQSFLDMLTKLAQLDPEFLATGKQHMQSIVENPRYVTLLMKRVESKTSKQSGTRRSYQRLGRPLIRHIEAAGGSVVMNQINNTMFPALSESELRRFRRVLRAGRIPGVKLLIVGEPRSANDTSHILVIPEATEQEVEA